MKNKGDTDHLMTITKKMLTYTNVCQQFSSDNVEYRFFTDSVMELSGASLVVLNLVSEKDKSKTTVKAVSGISEMLSTLTDAIGFNLEGSDWDGDYDAIKIIERNKLNSISSFSEAGFSDSIPRMASVLKLIEKIFEPGELYAMDFEYQGIFLGIMTLIMPKTKPMANKGLVELYIHQISGTIKRLRVELKLQLKMDDLKESESKFRTYMEESPLAIFVANKEGRYIDVNQAASTMTGYTKAELLNMTIPELLSPQFMEKNLELFHKVVTEGSAEVELMLRKKNGITFWVNLATVSIDRNKAIAFCQDITERKEKEERAKELNCLYSFSNLLQKEKNDLEKILKKTVKLLSSSFQYPEDVGVCIVLKGRKYKSKNYKPTSWKISAVLESYERQIGSIDVCYLSPPLDQQASFSKEEQLMLQTISEHLSRVAEQIQSREELQKSRNQLAATLDSIGDGVIVTDISGKIIRMNPRAEKLTGWTIGEAFGIASSEVFQIINASTGDLVSSPVNRVIESNQIQALADDTILIARDGSRCHIADSAAPILDEENRISGVIMVFSDVTDRKNVEESLKYQFRFEKMLAGISNNFASQPSDQLELSINQALKQIGEFFQVDRSYVFQFSDDGQYSDNTHEWCAEGIESQMASLQGIPIDTFPWWVKQTFMKKNVIISDVDLLPPEAEAEKHLLKSQDIQSLLSIPMMRNGIVFGFLGLDTVSKKKAWTDNQIMLLTVTVDLVSHAYTRNVEEQKIRYQSYHDGLTGLYNRSYLEKEMERLDTLRQLPIGIIMADLNDLKLFNDAFGHEVGDEMLKMTARVLKESCRKEDIIARWGGDEFVIFLPQTSKEDVKAIFFRIYEKCQETTVKDISLSLSVGYAIKSNVNEDLADIQKEAEQNMYKHKRDKSHHMNNDVMNVMLKELELKSYESVTHYSIMKNLAKKIGEMVGLSESSLIKLEILISLHDIGEIAITEEILTKKDSLTEEEWEIIKKHPETGYRIVRATAEAAHVAEEILSHHERWDGTGYPRGLKGTAIPLLARITTIVDAYEVMTSGRPYKQAMTKSEVIDELRRCSGSQFDPELIEVVLRLLISKSNTFE